MKSVRGRIPEPYFPPGFEGFPVTEPSRELKPKPQPAKQPTQPEPAVLA